MKRKSPLFPWSSRWHGVGAEVSIKFTDRGSYQKFIRALNSSLHYLNLHRAAKRTNEPCTEIIPRQSLWRDNQDGQKDQSKDTMFVEKGRLGRHPKDVARYNRSNNYYRRSENSLETFSNSANPTVPWESVKKQRTKEGSRGICQSGSELKVSKVTRDASVWRVR